MLGSGFMMFKFLVFSRSPGKKQIIGDIHLPVTQKFSRIIYVKIIINYCGDWFYDVQALSWFFSRRYKNSKLKIQYPTKDHLLPFKMYPEDISEIAKKVFEKERQHGFKRFVIALLKQLLPFVRYDFIF